MSDAIGTTCGVSIPKNIRIVRGELNDGCAPAGRHGRAHRHLPNPSPPNHAVCPLPHRGYTFDSAGLASATQPTLGNNASEEATPWGLYFFHYITF